MIALPQGAKGKALALTLCAVIAAAFYGGAARPLLAVYDARQGRLDEATATIARLERAAAQMPSLNRTLDALGTRSDLQAQTLPGSSDAVAAANLQAILAALATASGSGIASAEILPVQAQDDLRRVPLRISLTGDIVMLTKFLRGIDEARPPLFVDRLDLHSNATPGPTGNGGAPTLAITMDVYGFRQ
jgi:Tfp pilus assembly protein PilO